MYTLAKKFAEIVEKFGFLLAIICQGLLVVMALVLVVDIIGRYIGKPVYGITMLSVFLMIAVFYLNLAQTETQNEHIKVGVAIEYLPEKFLIPLSIFSSLFQITIFLLLIYASAKDLSFSYRTKEAIAGNITLPVWPTKFCILLGLIIYWFQILVNFIKKIQRRKAYLGIDSNIEVKSDFF